ncbi:hypothetical protein [Kordiimonas laminariae]|uniref:hypothetical protein n=1 Tax=Kordiimonas laminariae TaxID=2917717 RepID=UPI001FF1B818|nr:hypothetical protein [Kordiimonas laminariae]MCK0068086.1 hypothetical protein [Kordiimonas laminariae]
MNSDDFQNRPPRITGDVGGFSVSLASGEDDPRASLAGQEIMKFFQAKTEGQRLATRTDFTPRDFQKYLPKIALIDLLYDASGKVEDGVLRVSGSDLDAIFGPSTGMKVMDHPSGVGYRCIETAKLAVRERANVLADAQEVHPSKPFWTSRSVNIPLADEAGKITQLLIYVSVESKTGTPKE